MTKNEKYSQTARPVAQHTGIVDRPHRNRRPPGLESKLGMASSTSTLLVDPEGKLRIVPTASAGKELKQRFGLRPVYVNHLLNPSHNRNTLKE